MKFQLWTEAGAALWHQQQVTESEKIFSSRASVPIADDGLQLEVLSVVEATDP